MNLFEFLRNHKDTRVSQSYGDILEGKSDITDSMTECEKNVYMQLKNNDKKRILEKADDHCRTDHVKQSDQPGTDADRQNFSRSCR